MKTLFNLSFYGLALFALVVGCGKKDENNGGGGAPYQPSCIQTQYGCLPQGSCQAGYASYNGQCIPATGGGYVGNQSCNNGYIYNSQYNVCCPNGQYSNQCVAPGGGWNGGAQACPYGYQGVPPNCQPIQGGGGTGGWGGGIGGGSGGWNGGIWVGGGTGGYGGQYSPCMPGYIPYQYPTCPSGYGCFSSYGGGYCI